MAIEVEDGTGKSNAVAFCDATFVATYATLRGLTWPAQASTGALQEAAIVLGPDYLRNETRFPYRGTKKTASQSMPFPRTGCSEKNGPAIADTEIPFRLKEANARAAIMIANSGTTGALLNLEPSLERGGKITTSKIDVISTTFADDAPVETVYPAVQGILAPLLRSSGVQHAPIVGYIAEDETPFYPGEYDNA